MGNKPVDKKVNTPKGKHLSKYLFTFGIRFLLEPRPRNRSSRPLTIDLRQISINSIDRLDFWPFSRLSSTQRHGDRLDRLDRLYT